LSTAELLLEAVSFIGTVLLSIVADYQLNPVSSERVATFHSSRGLAPSFLETNAKFNPNATWGRGLLESAGRVCVRRTLAHAEPVPVCKRAELFVFNRHENNLATYIRDGERTSSENAALGEKYCYMIGAGPPGTKLLISVDGRSSRLR